MLFAWLTIVTALIGVALFGGRLLAGAANVYQTQLRFRLKDLAAESRAGALDAKRPLIARRREQSTALPAETRWITSGNDDRRRQQTRLVQAGIYNPKALFVLSLSKALFVGLPPLIGLVMVWLGTTDWRRGLLFAAIASGAGMILPSLWLERRIKRRHVVLRRSLADFLDLMIVCLESGLSLQGTIQRVSDELRVAHPDLAGELAIVQREINIGATVDAALRRFADRSGFEGIRSLATFVREAQRFGTQLAEALRLHADMLRSQRENAAEETAQKAAVKILIPMLLLILPAVFVVLAGPAAIQIQQAFAK